MWSCTMSQSLPTRWVVILSLFVTTSWCSSSWPESDQQEHQYHHLDDDWEDECRNAVGCLLIQGDLTAAVGRSNSAHHKLAANLALYFDMELLNQTMKREEQFAWETNDETQFKEMGEALAKVGVHFYPKNADEFKMMKTGGQALIRPIKHRDCQVSLFKCAGEVARMKKPNPHTPSTPKLCGSGWEAASYVYFGCANIEGWPKSTAKVLRYDQKNCGPIRVRHCASPEFHPGGRHAKGAGPERRGYYYNAADEDIGTWIPFPADSPECKPRAPTLDEGEPPSPWFGEFKCGSFVSVWDGRDLGKSFDWRSRNYGAARALAKKADWGPWYKCEPGKYVTSMTLMYDDKQRGIEFLSLNCEPPRRAVLMDEKFCNGPLNGLKVAAALEGSGIHFLTHVAGRCGWARDHPVYLYDFDAGAAGGGAADSIDCSPGEAVVAFREYKTSESPGMTSSFLHDIQIKCSRLEYPCTASDAWVADPELGGDYSLQAPEKFSRMYIVGLDTKMRTSSSGSTKVGIDYSAEASISITKNALSRGLGGALKGSTTTGTTWSADRSITEKEATWTTQSFTYPEGLLTRYYRALGFCGVGRLWSAAKPFPVSFVSTAHCALSEAWNYVPGFPGRAEFPFSMVTGINFTNPARSYFTGPPFLNVADIAKGLEARLVGEFEVRPRPTLGDLKPLAVDTTSGGAGGAGDPQIIFQRVVRCSAPNKPEHYIDVYTQEVKLVPLPLSGAEGPAALPSDEYRLVRESFRDAGTHSYNITLGITWDALTAQGPGEFHPAEAEVAPLVDKLRPAFSARSQSESNTKYAWSRNKEWHLVNGGHKKAEVVEVKDGEEVEVFQVVGRVGPFTVFTDHTEVARYEKSGKTCTGGTGIFADCGMTKFRS